MIRAKSFFFKSGRFFLTFKTGRGHLKPVVSIDLQNKIIIHALDTLLKLTPYQVTTEVNIY